MKPNEKVACFFSDITEATMVSTGRSGDATLSYIEALVPPGPGLPGGRDVPTGCIQGIQRTRVGHHKSDWVSWQELAALGLQGYHSSSLLSAPRLK